MSRRFFLFLTSSARAHGNAWQLAQLAARGLTDAQDWRDLAGLPPFVDLRPDFAPPGAQLQDLRAAICAASDLVFVAPVYWYALPAPAKLLLDHWSGWLDDPASGFAEQMRGKTAWLITARADPDPTVADLPTAMLRRSVEWLGLRWGGALHGVGDAAGDILSDTAATTAAQTFFFAPPA